MSKLFTLIIFVSLHLIFARSTAAQESWRLDKDKGGVKVYTRPVENSAFREFRAEMWVKSDLKSIENILDDFYDFPNWQANMDSVALVKKVNENIKILYFVSDLPWPVTNRDFIFKHVKEQRDDGKTLVYHNEIMPDELPRQDGLIRVQKAEGFWRITTTTEATHVVYQWKGDPAGSIPGWLMNLFVVDGPHETLYNLKRKLE